MELAGQLNLTPFVAVPNYSSGIVMGEALKPFPTVPDIPHPLVPGAVVAHWLSRIISGLLV